MFSQFWEKRPFVANRQSKIETLKGYSFVATPISGTVPLTVTFTDLSTGDPTSWLWEFGDGATATAQHPEHTYTAAGTYTVTLTVSNGFGSDTATGMVTVLNSVTDIAKVVRRIGYRFGGQLIATRVEAEDAQGQLIDNPAFTGLFYVHSDHLGSANAMSYGQDRPALAGTLVPGSVARFLPSPPSWGQAWRLSRHAAADESSREQSRIYRPPT